MMKYMKKIFLFVLTIGLFAGCSKSFLNTQPLTEKTNSSFYLTDADFQQALTATYHALVEVPSVAGSILNVYPFVISELMSDERFGGGGDNDLDPKAISEFTITGPDLFRGAWSRAYTGIFRANMIIASIDGGKFSSADVKGQVEGEALFLRAMYYFDLSRMFGDVPLITEAAPMNIPRTPAAKVYAQIATDLKTAISVFPATPYSASTYDLMGHANKWCAEALMARVFLFYTGYYETTTLPLNDGTSSIASTDVVAWLEDCITNSGYQLMPDFSALWPYAIEQAPYSDSTYNYVKVNNVPVWYGEKGGNFETMFALKFSTFANWSTTIYYSNQMDLFFGWRNYDFHAYGGFVGDGWGMGTVNKTLWDAWDDSDIRKKASIMDVTDPDEAVSAIYTLDGSDPHDKQMDETGYWQKKYRPVNVYKKAIKDWHNYSIDMWGISTKNFQLDNTQDIVLLRFADVLLMHSEISQTVDGINKVRERVGLPDIGTYTLAALQNERRFELAFEGERYYDLLRWAGKSNIASLQPIFDAENGVTTMNNGVWGQMKGVDFRPITGGFVQIPNTEIALSQGILVQNPGWETGTAPVFSYK